MIRNAFRAKVKMTLEHESVVYGNKTGAVQLNPHIIPQFSILSHLSNAFQEYLYDYLVTHYRFDISFLHFLPAM